MARVWRAIMIRDVRLSLLQIMHDTHPVRGMYLKMGDPITGLERETQSLLEWRLSGEAEEVTCSKMNNEDTRCAISNLNRRQRVTFIRPEGSST
jgi:hypothetical protein